MTDSNPAPTRTAGPVSIDSNMSGPCRCGCKGKDPWHARTFKRIVRNISPTSPQITGGFAIIATGMAQMPWGYAGS